METGLTGVGGALVILTLGRGKEEGSVTILPQAMVGHNAMDLQQRKKTAQV